MCSLMYFYFISLLNSRSWRLWGDTMLSNPHTPNPHPGGWLPAGSGELWQRAHPRGHSEVRERRASQWPRVQPRVCATEIIGCCRALCLGNQHHTLPRGTHMHTSCHTYLVSSKLSQCLMFFSVQHCVLIVWSLFYYYLVIFCFPNYHAALGRFL